VPANAPGNRIHRFLINITPAILAANGGSITVRILDAESNGDRDEVDGATIGTSSPNADPVDNDPTVTISDPTRFRLIGPTGAVIDTQTTGSNSNSTAGPFPADGTTITFPAITTPGVYTVTSETGALPIFGNNDVLLNNDDNGFVIDVPGVTGLLIGQTQGTFQQDTTGNINVPLFTLVGPGTTQLRLRNFDLDGNGAVNYVSPQNVTTNGTVSGNAVWNNSGDLNNGEDTITIPALTSPTANDFGAWGINLTNYNSDNQTLFQANSNVGLLPLFDSRPTSAGNFTITPNTICSVPAQPSATPPDDALCTGPSRNTSVDHPFTVTNNFFTNDIVNLALPAADPNYTVQLLDSNGAVLPDTDSDGVPDTGILTPGQSRQFILRVTPNAGVTVNNTTVISGTSFMDRRVRSQLPAPTQPVPQTVEKITRVQAGNLGSVVFLDANGNGVQDPGETGVSGVSVTLLDPGPDGLFDGNNDTTSTTTTSATGQYSFTVTPGRNYRVTIAPPAGFNLTSTQATVSPGLTLSGLSISGQPSLNFNFGLRGGTTVGDTVFFDVNNNATQQANEPGVPNVTVTLFNAATNAQVGTTTTDAQGQYSFPNLAPGQYRAVITPPAGTTVTTPGGATQTTPTLTNGQSDLDRDFGLRGNLTIGNDVFIDVNNNGTREPNEAGIPNTTVTLFTAGPDGQLNTADDLAIATTTTNATGNYTFSNLVPGNYRVQVTPPAGFTATTPTTVNVPLSVSLDNIDFGFRGTNTLGDTVFNDINSNTIQDAGEPGLSGVQLRLTTPGPDNIPGNGDDVLVATTTTNASGGYTFTNLPNGTYRVTVVPLTGLTATTPTFFDRTLNGTPVNDADFGLNTTGLIGDRVYLDLNNNGQQDANEFGVPGVTVTSDGGNGIFGDPNDVTTVTDANGNYSFGPLTAGNYSIRVSPPTGFTATTPTTIAGPLAANQIDLSRDFGLRGPGRISRIVYQDTNSNGSPDAGEPGVSGVTVQLRLPGPDGNFDTTDDVLVSTTTDANGLYEFTGLPLQDYRVTVIPPANSTLITPQTVPLTLTAAAPQGVANFGLQSTASSTLRLVKRITNVTRNGTTVPGFDFNAVINDPSPNDDAPGWSQIPLRGQVNVNGGATLRTGDEITYTVYFLAEGATAFGTNLCDQIPTGTSFIAGSNQVQRNNGSPALDGTAFSPLQPLPAGNACQNQSNPNGSVVFNLGDIQSTSGSNFGFIRFRVRIN
jgi:protocatechuate 3,4-dioxygenase beta subunit